MEGYLHKRKKKSSFMKNWDKRYFILKNANLAYFQKAGSTHEPRDIIDLRTTKEIRDDPDDDNVFVVHTDAREYYLKAPTYQDKLTWIKVLHPFNGAYFDPSMEYELPRPTIEATMQCLQYLCSVGEEAVRAFDREAAEQDVVSLWTTLLEDANEIDIQNSPEVVASVLMRLLGYAPDSLFTTSLYPRFRNVDLNENGVHVKLNALVRALPPDNLDVMTKLTESMSRIAAHADDPREHINHLARVLSPYICRKDLSDDIGMADVLATLAADKDLIFRRGVQLIGDTTEEKKAPEDVKKGWGHGRPLSTSSKPDLSTADKVETVEAIDVGQDYDDAEDLARSRSELNQQKKSTHSLTEAAKNDLEQEMKTEDEQKQAEDLGFEQGGTNLSLSMSDEEDFTLPTALSGDIEARTKRASVLVEEGSPSQTAQHSILSQDKAAGTPAPEEKSRDAAAKPPRPVAQPQGPSTVEPAGPPLSRRDDIPLEELLGLSGKEASGEDLFDLEEFGLESGTLQLTDSDEEDDSGLSPAKPNKVPAPLPVQVTKSENESEPVPDPSQSAAESPAPPEEPPSQPDTTVAAVSQEDVSTRENMDQRSALGEPRQEQEEPEDPVNIDFDGDDTKSDSGVFSDDDGAMSFFEEEEQPRSQTAESLKAISRITGYTSPSRREAVPPSYNSAVQKVDPEPMRPSEPQDKPQNKSNTAVIENETTSSDMKNEREHHENNRSSTDAALGEPTTATTMEPNKEAISSTSDGSDPSPSLPMASLSQSSSKQEAAGALPPSSTALNQPDPSENNNKALADVHNMGGAQTAPPSKTEVPTEKAATKVVVESDSDASDGHKSNDSIDFIDADLQNAELRSPSQGSHRSSGGANEFSFDDGHIARSTQRSASPVDPARSTLPPLETTHSPVAAGQRGSPRKTKWPSTDTMDLNTLIQEVNRLRNMVTQEREVRDAETKELNMSLDTQVKQSTAHANARARLESERDYAVGELEQSQTKAQLLEKQLSHLSQEKHSLEARNQELTQQVQSDKEFAEKEIDHLRQELGTKSKQMEDLQARLEHAEQSFQDISRQASSISEERDELQSRCERAEAGLTSLRRNHEALKHKHTTANNERDSLQQELNTTKRKMQSTLNDLEALQTRLRDTDSSRSNLQKKLSAERTRADEQLHTLRKQLQEVQVALAQQTDLLQAEQRKSTELQNTLTRVTQRGSIDEQRSRQNQLDAQRYRKLLSDFDELTNGKTEAENKLAELQVKLKTAQQSNQRLLEQMSENKTAQRTEQQRLAADLQQARMVIQDLRARLDKSETKMNSLQDEKGATDGQHRIVSEQIKQMREMLLDEIGLKQRQLNAFSGKAEASMAETKRRIAALEKELQDSRSLFEVAGPP